METSLILNAPPTLIVHMFTHRHRKQPDDVAWFEQAVDEHRDDVYGFAIYFLRDAEDAADVTQEVLIRLWKHRRSIERSTAGAWLKRVCRNACIDRLRQRTARRAESLGDVQTEFSSDHEPPDLLFHVDQLQQLLMDLLEEMDEPFKSLIIMREIQEMPYAEIAAAMDLPLNTVKVYLHRARKKLRDAVPDDVRKEVV